VVHTNQDLKNKFRIYNLVKNHFGLTEDSLKLFRFRLFQEPHVAPEYAKLLNGAPDLRLRRNISEETILLETIDAGWKTFRDCFHEFLDYNKMTYEDFRNNKVTIDKQEMKLQKAVTNFYKTYGNRDKWRHAHDEYCIPRHFEEIGARKLSNKDNLELVLSLNFADWFLCSTGEKWCSCLNLESDYENAYWSGLPGIIGDKNRSLLYITDGKKKNYQGIEVDRVINRTWVLTVRPKVHKSEKAKRSNSVFMDVGEYPNYLHLAKIAKQVWGMEWRDDDYINRYGHEFISRYYMEYLFHIGQNRKYGITSYIYQDNTNNCLAKKKKGKYSHMGYLRNGGGGAYRWDLNKNSIDRDAVYYTGGLKRLIEMKKSIMDPGIDEDAYGTYCDNCDSHISDNDAYEVNGYFYCRDCYSDRYFDCEYCGNETDNDEAYIVNIRTRSGATTYQQQVCECCYDENYFECSDCRSAFSIDEETEIENTGKIVCKNCLSNDNYFTCDCCNDTFEHRSDEKPNELDNELYCTICHKEEIKRRKKLAEGITEKKEEPMQVASFTEIAKTPITFSELIKTPIYKPKTVENALTEDTFKEAIEHMTKQLMFNKANPITRLSNNYADYYRKLLDIKKDDE
jgi:hypothetical protein